MRGANSREHFAEASPAGIGDKGEARPIAEWRTAFATVGEEIASADTAVRDATRKMREIDRQIAQLEVERKAKPPSKLEVRMDVAAPAATKATLRVTYNVRNARWLPLYDARLDTGAKDRKPQARAGPPCRSHAIDRRGLVQRHARRLHGPHRSRRQRAGAEFAGRTISAGAEAAGVGLSFGFGNACGGADAAAKDGSRCPPPDPADDIRERAEEQQAVAEIGDFQATYQNSRPCQPWRRRGRQEPAHRLDDGARRSHVRAAR